MSWWQALNYGMAGVATGGFTVSSRGMADFGSGPRDAIWSPSALLFLCLAMWCGGDACATTGGLKRKRVLLLGSRAFVLLKALAVHPWRLMKYQQMADEAERACLRLEAALIMALLWMGRVETVPMLVVLAAVAGGRWRRRS